MTHAILVDHAWLQGKLGQPGIVLVDTRPAHDYWAGHLPGARHLDTALFSHSDTSAAGLIALRAQFTWIFSTLGIAGDEHVVFYEKSSESRAARGAWLLEYLGHPRVSILDGGLASSGDIALVRDAPAVVARPFAAQPNAAAVASAADIVERLNRPGVRVLDTRRAAEYYGEEKRAKHAGAIPGALHRDYASNIGADGKFKPAAELRALYESMGLRQDDEIIAYCGGGVRAAHTYYALKLAGFSSPRNYTGSWGEWGNRDDLPVQVPVRAGA